LLGVDMAPHVLSQSDTELRDQLYAVCPKRVLRTWGS
jgi:hypothetical protein